MRRGATASRAPTGLAPLVATALVAACGGASASSSPGHAPAQPYAEVSSGGSAFALEPGAFRDDVVEGELARPEAAPRYAQAAAAAGATTAVPTPPPPPTATDAVDLSGPLLIYEATLHLSVFEVEETQRAVIDALGPLGGYVQQRRDTMLVMRVPAPKFQEALAVVEGLGDVLHRDVRALDVGEEFRDVTIRLRNAEAMRDRLEALLAQAHSVEDALRVERELERITESIETMKGRLRGLSDRIAFSTITMAFQPRPRASLEQPDTFRLPFGWLDELGLRSLLNLAGGQ